jgi:signal transduction histidine kinase
MGRGSIRGQLIAIVVLSQALLAVGLLFAGLFYMHKRLVSALDTRMQSHALSLAALARYTEEQPETLYFDKTLVTATLDPDRDDSFVIWSDHLGVLFQSDNWPKNLDARTTGTGHWSFTSAGAPYRGLRLTGVPVLDREPGDFGPPELLNIAYASPMLALQNQVRETGIFIAAASLILLGMTVLFALWGIRRGLLPLQHLAAQAGKVSTQNWELHLPSGTQETTELQPLIDSMQTMLGRLQRSFTQQREFLGNAAHELKTPVTVLKSTLQSLLQRPRNSEDYQTGLANCLEDLERLEKLLQWMFRLARAEQWAYGAQRPDLQVIDMAGTCEEAIERIHHLADAHGTTIELARNGSVPLRADPEDLQLVWTNLLENAVRHGREGGLVKVSVACNNGGPARIVFEDQGPGIPAADLPHIFDRFYRGDRSRSRATGGYGLGLAISKALIEAYGGNITADSAPGRGTRMIVELPLTSV